MKLASTTALLLLIAGPAVAQTGNIHGTESRGAGLNESYRASAVNPATGYTPGHRVVVKKKKHKRVYVSPRVRRY